MQGIAMQGKVMKRWSGLIGFIGLVVLAFGVAGGLVVNSFALPLIAAHLVAGVVLLVLWFCLFGVKNLGEAGEVALGRTARFSFNAGLYSVFFLALLVLVNWFVHRHDKRWDLTEQGVYSLSPASQQVLQNLKKPLKLVAFKSNPQNDQELDELFGLYKYYNPSRVTTETINPRTKPHLVEKYGMKEGNVVYLEYGEGEKAGVARINEATEQGVTNAIIKLSRGEAKKIYFVEGHGEPSLDKALSSFKGGLEDEHLTAEGILLGQKDSVPADAAAVVLVGPTKPLLPAERELLLKYVNDGGRFLMFHEPRTSNVVSDLAQQFGIQVDNDIVVDLQARLFAGPVLGVQIAARDFGTHAITKNFAPQTPVVFELASSVRPVSEVQSQESKPPPPAGVTYTALVKSGPKSWGETNLTALFDESQPSASLDPDDIKGPVSLAVAYEKKLSAAPAKTDTKSDGEQSFEKVARVVVVGDSDLITNNGIGYYSNRDFALNVVSWLAGEEGGITVGRKSLRNSAVSPISAETYHLILASSLVLPELLLLFGLAVWWRRKTAELALA